MHRLSIKKQISRGFTIAEMGIVVIIFIILTSVIIFRYGDFNSSILVSNMAYEVAITTRQAQVFGLGARGYKSGSVSEFIYPYGLFINMNDNEGADEGTTKKFALFIDRSEQGDAGYGQCNMANDTGACSCLPGDECQEMYRMQRDIAVSDIKVEARNFDGCEADTVDRLAVTFKRPNPEALITWQTVGLSGYDFVQIEVSDRSRQNIAYVLIRESGQISVSKDNICDKFGGGGGNSGDA